MRKERAYCIDITHCDRLGEFNFEVLPAEAIGTQRGRDAIDQIIPPYLLRRNIDRNARNREAGRAPRR